MIKKHGRILLGLLGFAVAIAFLLFVAYYLQVTFGMVGMILTELGILVIALLGWLVSRRSFKEVFPLKRPDAEAMKGGAQVYFGVYSVTLGVSYLLLYFFPGMSEVSGALGEFFSQGDAWLAVLGVAILPGICEEALNRGFILSTFKSVRRTWVVVLCMGVLFGLFHMDVYRFLPTALLGAGLTYIAIKTGNLLLPILFHTTNNLISLLPVLFGMDSGGAGGALVISPFALAGSLMFFFSLGALLLYFGVRSLNGKSWEINPKAQRRKAVIKVVCNIFIFIGLVGMFFSAPVQPVFETNFTITLTEPFHDGGQIFTVKTPDSYTILLKIEGENALGIVTITDSSGAVVYQVQGEGLTLSEARQFAAGDYAVSIDLVPQNGATDVPAAVSLKVTSRLGAILEGT